MIEIAVRIAWFMMGWTAAFGCLMVAYLGCQLYWDSRR